MTEQNENISPGAPEPPVGDAQTSDEQSTATTETDAQNAAQLDGSPNAEAKRYRRRLRATEAERDQLAERLETLRRQNVEQLADDAGIRPQALWASGAQLDDLIADDGSVDHDRVAAACEHAADELGLRKQVGTRVPNEGRHHGSATPTSQQRMVDVVMGNNET